MPRIHVVTEDGTLVESFDLSKWDLTKALAKQALINEIFEAIQDAVVEEGQGN